MSQRVENTATITFNGNTLDPTCPVITNVEPNIGIDKVAITDKGTYSDNDDANEVGEGRQIRYQVTLTNYSSQAFTNIDFTDVITLPAGVTASQISYLAPPDSSYANTATLPNIAFDVPDIPAESHVVVFYTIELDESVPTDSKFTNCATVDYDENPTEDPFLSNLVGVTYKNTETTIEATKTASSDNVLCGEIYSYTLTFENTGLNPATNVTVTDYLPSTFVVSTVTVNNGGTDLVEGTDFNYSVDALTNELTVTSIGTALDIAGGDTLTVVISGSVPCPEAG